MAKGQQMAGIPKKIRAEIEHFKKSKIPRCQTCHKNFIKESEYIWKPTCKCAKNVRLAIG